MDNDVSDLKKEIQQLKAIVQRLESEITLLNKKVSQQRFVNDQLSNNLRRVAASRN